MSQLKETQSQKQIIFGGRFILKKFSGKIQHYNIYHGVDLETREQVTAYVKLYRLSDTRNGFCKGKLDLYGLLPATPKFIWSGDERINNIIYRVEIFQKLGPSLEEIMKIATAEIISGHTPHIIIYNIVLLLEKLHQYGMVYRYLSPTKFFFSKKPHENEIFLAEFIECHRKGDTAPSLADKYSSIGSHLGLPCSAKDDWESLCYIIVDLFTQGAYFQLPKNLPSSKKSQSYFTRKSEINPLDLKSVPIDYVNFCMYIRNLAPEQQPLLEHWKKQFRSNFLIEELKTPYSWVPRKQSLESIKEQITSDPPQQLSDSEDVFESCRELALEEQSLSSKLSRIIPIETKLQSRLNQ